MKSFFCNRTVDKSEMKRLIKWVLLNYGTQKATRFVDSLKTLGFQYATLAGISLGVDDLRIPPVKGTFLRNAQLESIENDLRCDRGQITVVERLEKALEIWNTTNDTLKNEVINHFRETDIFNPVYMMAFSGARGNISQVRQLVGMRGLMADPQGQILDFPIQRNFREGLTVTEYMISCYGARKGLVDTALRTANSGYLTRRLVDVAQNVIIKELDCDPHDGITVVPNAQRHGSELVGRVLFETVMTPDRTRVLARKGQDISPQLAKRIAQVPRLRVRSPLTCRFNTVCQLCYGWNLAHHGLVQLGEAVGVLAAQSIGEPGTQLTMRTFHTGGVFAGEATERVYAPHSGRVSYIQRPCGRKVVTRYGEVGFLTFRPVQIRIQRQTNSSILEFPALTLLFTFPGQQIRFHQSLAELSRLNKETVTTQAVDLDTQPVQRELRTTIAGQVAFEGLTLKIRRPEEEHLGRHQQTTVDVQTKGRVWILNGHTVHADEPIRRGTKFYPSHYPLVLSSKFVPPTESSGSSQSHHLFLPQSIDLFRSFYEGGPATRTRPRQFLVKGGSVSGSHAPRLKQATTVCGPWGSFHFSCLQRQGSRLDRKSRQGAFTLTLYYPTARLRDMQTYRTQKDPVTKVVVRVTRVAGATDPKVSNYLTRVWPGYYSEKYAKAGLDMPQTLLLSSFWRMTTRSVYTRQDYLVTGNPVYTGLKYPQRRVYHEECGHGNVQIIPIPHERPSLQTGPKRQGVHNGEIRLLHGSGQMLLLRSMEQYGLRLQHAAVKPQIGDFIRRGDEINIGYQTTVSGQIIRLGNDVIHLRAIQPHGVAPGTTLHVMHGDFVQANDLFATIVLAESKAGDIVQGLPKVDELLEAREPPGRVLTGMHARLAMAFQQYSKTYGLYEGSRRSFQDIRQILVEEVQSVYRSQGVFIADKHVEIIVRQMTTKVFILEPGNTGLLPGDMVDMHRIEALHHKLGGHGLKYRPILLGITRASLAAESFIAAASFQETKRVLARAAVEGSTDWITGLKENVILGRLIPAGTGLYTTG